MNLPAGAAGSVIRIHPAANVVIARRPLPGGGVLDAEGGMVRADGRTATRSGVGFLTSVNGSATAARAVADPFRRDIHPEALAPRQNVRGVVALTHGMDRAPTTGTLR